MRDKRKESQVEMKMKVKNFSYMFQIQFGSLIFQRNYRKHYSYSFHRINNWSNYLYLEIDFTISLFYIVRCQHHASTILWTLFLAHLISNLNTSMFSYVDIFNVLINKIYFYYQHTDIIIALYICNKFDSLSTFHAGQ